MNIPGSPFWLAGGWVRPEVSDTFPKCPLCGKSAQHIYKPYGGLGLAMRRLWWPCCNTMSEPKNFLEWAVKSAGCLVEQTGKEGAWPQQSRVGDP